ncbi:hypothetical protein HanPI659440_Chr00c10g0722721 [Helianthus annuus]|nr:hypothetical protein HanPI659440_Chr00c10g0722721 [Helianthus annuus]
MGLKEALRLKSFDLKELDIRATKTPKGDPPYLSIVQGNLYQIRVPEAPDNQGGSGSAPVAQTANVVPAQAVVVVDDAEGNKTGLIGTKGSGSKIVIEDEGVHLSVGDEEAPAGGEKGDGDDKDEDEEDEEGEKEHPQVSFKRKWAVSTKSDPKLKQVNRKKTEFKTITLDDDDHVTEFSTARGILENLDAHLHGGRTPRDRPVKFPSSPSFGGGAIKVITDARTSDPKKAEPSPSGKFTTGVASNVSRPSPMPIDGGDSASSSPLWYNTEAIFLSRELGSGGIEDMDSARAL